MSATEMVFAPVNLPRLASVRPLPGVVIRVDWSEGARAGRSESVDLAPLIGQMKLYAPLRHDEALFATIRLAEDGGAVEWGDGSIDMAASSIERLASEQMTAEDFEAFLKRNKLTHRGAAAALGRSLRMIQNYVDGEPIPRVVALACKGYESGLAQQRERRSA